MNEEVGLTYSKTGIETFATSERCISVYLAWRSKRGRTLKFWTLNQNTIKELISEMIHIKEREEWSQFK